MTYSMIDILPFLICSAAVLTPIIINLNTSNLYNEANGSSCDENDNISSFDICPIEHLFSLTVSEELFRN